MSEVKSNPVPIGPEIARVDPVKPVSRRQSGEERQKQRKQQEPARTGGDDDSAAGGHIDDFA